MKSFVTWWRDHWPVIALVAAGLGAMLIFRNRRANDIMGQLRVEQDAIAAAKKARRDEANYGHTIAKLRVEAEHAEALAKLTADEAAEARRLRDDPAELSKFLVRVSRTP